MLNEKKVLAIIAARGGSKGLPGKNVAPCAGKPLIAWSIEAARASSHVDRVIVTTDDEQIMRAAYDAGAEVPFVRPPELATDDARLDAVVLHAIDSLSEAFDFAVLLQATSPLRTAGDIDGALELLSSSGASSVVSVTHPSKSPFWMYTIAGEALAPLIAASDTMRRQELPEVFVLNGAVYAFDVPRFRQQRRFISADTRPWFMPQDRSVDIDTSLDLALAELLLLQRST